MINKHFQLVIIILNILILPLCCISVSADEEYSIFYESYLDMEIDTSIFEDDINLDVYYTIPITLKYWTNIPDFFKSIPFSFSSKFLFDTDIDPMMEINLQVNRSPDWADISFSTSDLLIEIPYETDGVRSVDTNLIIKLSSDAPRFLYTIDIFASTDNLKRLIGNNVEESITFLPVYTPSMEISLSEPLKNIDRYNETIIQFMVKNKSNHRSRITASFNTNKSSFFNMLMDPVSINLNLEEEGYFNLSVYLNTEFGFFEDVNLIEQVEINFKCEEYPIVDKNNSIQESAYVSLKYVQNDFEDYLDSYLIIIIGLCVFSVIVIYIFYRFYRFMKRRN